MFGPQSLNLKERKGKIRLYLHFYCRNYQNTVSILLNSVDYCFRKKKSSHKEKKEKSIKDDPEIQEDIQKHGKH